MNIIMLNNILENIQIWKKLSMGKDGGVIKWTVPKNINSNELKPGTWCSFLHLPQAAHTALAQDCCLVPLQLPAVRPSPQPVIAESGAPSCSHIHYFSLSPHLFSL